MVRVLLYPIGQSNIKIDGEVKKDFYKIFGSKKFKEITKELFATKKNGKNKQLIKSKYDRQQCRS